MTSKAKALSGIIIFLSGMFVGTLTVSLVVVNYHVESSISQSISQSIKQQEFQSSNKEYQQRAPDPDQKQKQLRIEQSLSPRAIGTDMAGDIRRIETNATAENLPQLSAKETSVHLLTQHQQKKREENSLAVSSSSSSSVSFWEEPSFFDLAKVTGTDKVKGNAYLQDCLENDSLCTRPSCERKKCRPWGHFYETIYQQKFSKFLKKDDSFQLLEIGYNLGFGYDTYKKFFSTVPGAELHTIEISCIEEGPRKDGKWPWGNFAKENKDYQTLLDKKRLHCGDASDVDWLHRIWNDHIFRQRNSDDVSPPLKIVIDDGSHLAKHMIYSIFFWFPRIEPGGILIIEDIQPIEEANLFRTQFLPQIMADLHFCGDPNEHKDQACFPQLYPLLQSIHCEMHICVFERNEEPAVPLLSIEKSKPPPNALDMTQCYTFANVFGLGMEAV